MNTRFLLFFFLLAILLFPAKVEAQLNYYPGGFSTTSGTYTDLGTSGTVISVANSDDAFSGPLPIGFTFNFNGAPYDSFVFSTNGFIKLGSDTPSRHFLFTSHAQPPANGPFTATTSPAPAAKDTSMLFAFGQDLYAGTNASEFRYFTSGSPGTQVCTIQWKNVKDKLQASVAGLWDTINFQIKLYEGTNVIEYVYGKWTSTVSVSAARFSAVGIVGKSMTTANQNLHLVKGSTVAWSGTVAVTGFYANNGVNYRNPTSTPPGPAPGIGRIFAFAPLTANDAAVRAVYAQGRIAQPYHMADSIRANILNNGVNAITGLTVTLTISGANTYTTTATVASLAPNATTNVAFAPFWPTSMGPGLITVSVPSDDNNANNTKTYSFSVSDTRNGYTDTLLAASGSNGTTVPQFWGAKYFVSGSGLVKQVRSPLVINSDAVNDTVCGMILDSNGLILARSPNYIVQTSDLGTTLVFNLSLPVAVSNQSIIAGIAGGQSVNGLNYFLGTSQSENPMRPNTQFYFMGQTLPGGITSALPGLLYATPIGWTTTRLMMECTIEPIPPVDVGVSASLPASYIKVPTNTAITLQAVVKNYGTQTRSAGIPVSYRINNGTIVGPVATGSTILSGDTGMVSFTGLSFSTPGTYTLKIFTGLSGDAIPGNDTLVVVYNAVAALALPYRQTGNMLGNWTVAGNSTSVIWKQKSCIQPNGNVVANSLYADNIVTPAGREAWIYSPPLNFSGQSNPVVHFYLAHAPNTFLGTDDTLEFAISNNGGQSFTKLYTRSSQNTVLPLGTDTATSLSYTPNVASDWRYECIGLSAFANSPFVTIAFRNRSASGNGVYISNIAVTNPTSASVQSVSSTGTFISGPISFVFSSIGNTAGEVTITRNTGTPFSSATPVIATNTTATTSSSAIYTPSNLSQTHWWSLAYTGVGTGYSPLGVQYTVNIDLSSIPGVSYPDSLYLLRRCDFSGSWIPITTNVSSTNLYSNALTGFSDFVLGSTLSANPLPVSWLYLQGKVLTETENYLEWATVSEINTRRFIVERSLNGIDFNQVGETAAAGFSERTHTYSFTDVITLSEPKCYYRIVSEDFDGTVQYSKTIVLDRNATDAEPVVEISNPFQQSPSLLISDISKETTMEVKVFDMQGKLLFTQNINAPAGNSRWNLDSFNAWPAGCYLIQIESASGQTQSRKVLKLN